MNSANLDYFEAMEISGALNAREVSAMSSRFRRSRGTSQIDGAISGSPYMATVSPVGRGKNGLPMRVQGSALSSRTARHPARGTAQTRDRRVRSATTERGETNEAARIVEIGGQCGGVSARRAQTGVRRLGARPHVVYVPAASPYDRRPAR